MNCHLLPKWLKTLEKILEGPMNAEQVIQMQNQIFEAAKLESENTGQPIPQELIDNQVVNQINKQVNPDFRIFLTTEPTTDFPLSIVSNSIKVTTEPPSSLKLNMVQTFSKITDDQIMECRRRTLSLWCTPLLSSTQPSRNDRSLESWDGMSIMISTPATSPYRLRFLRRF